MENNYIGQIPVFYYDALNSQARSCYMLIKILKIFVKVEEINFVFYDDLSDMSSWMNNFYTAPTLVDGGVTLCHGPTIMMYLCEKYGSAVLRNIFPRDYVARLKIISLLFYEAYFMHKYLGHMLSDIFLCKYEKFDGEYHGRKVAKAYNNLNTFLNGHTYMASNYFTIADIAAISTVSAFHIIYPIDYEQYPQLFNWYNSVKKMSFYQYNEEGIFKLRYLLEMVGKFPFPSPFRKDGKKPSIKSEDDQRSEGGRDSKIRKIHSKSPKKKEKFLETSEISTTSSGNDTPAQKPVMSETVSSAPDLEQKTSLSCKPGDAKVDKVQTTSKRSKLYEETLSEYSRRNYYLLPKNCEEGEYTDSQACEASQCSCCPTVERIDYSGGLCNQPITYQVSNAADQRPPQDLRHKTTTAANNSEGMAFCSYHNGQGMCWCNQTNQATNQTTNQMQYSNNDCTNPKVNTKNDEKKICESIIHVAVEKLKKQKMEQGKRCSKISIESKLNCGENCSGTDTSYSTYVWYPQTCRIQKSAACCNLIRDGCCKPENTPSAKQEARNGIQNTEQVHHRYGTPTPDKWCAISQKSIEICDIPPNPPLANQPDRCKDCNCQQLQINCYYCRSNPDVSYCNPPNSCNQSYGESCIDGANSCKTNTPIRQQSGQGYTQSQCFENSMQTFPGCGLTIQEHDSGNIRATGKVKKFPVIKGSPIDGKITRRFFILSTNNLNEKDETSPATLTDLSEENKKEQFKKRNPPMVMKKRPLNRLQAGSTRDINRKIKLRRKRASQFTDDSVDTLTDDSEEVTKIIYHICMKDDLPNTRKCKCNKCTKAEYRKSFKSKIPRLIPNYRNSIRNIDRIQSDYEVFGKSFF